MVQLGQYSAPKHVIAHLSDTHLLDDGRPLGGVIHGENTLGQALRQLERAERVPEAIVITGDLTDLGEPGAYRRLRELIEPAAERIGAHIVWVMGNHDERPAYSRELYGADSVDDDQRPQDRVHHVGGLRIIALDTSVPRYHHGDLTEQQLDWLRDILADPAPDGTLLALHHPPIPSPVELMAILELRGQHRLADVVRGTDVIGILGGHLHYATHATFAGVPVSVAAATCYTIDVSAPPGNLRGIDAGQTINLVEVYDDTVVHSVIPVADTPQVTGFTGAVLERLAAMSERDRLEAFSSKASTFDPADLTDDAASP